ncbi:malto-oligosyltrehalose trehalohydrolase [Gluconobacter morbifer]|uniref:Malto-oligosyltrehalose trehalohydrolase n=1 Tax=Gluconobacter morbifer G707 TaxID=1088869 RepID=G6XF08_9PROT|nr:malto-oligosyltrehalose trehalohydrolase [Gluconobacter morbifer]EHH68766.1 malto-oligosyltrehalose trehalohydrolase [Gluconobacter morbifer G707]
MASFRFENRSGAELLAPDRTRFSFWAPACETVLLEVEGLPPVTMEQQDDGFFTAEATCGAGTRYRYRIREGFSVPDPASRYQPEGVHGPSEIIDPEFYQWKQPDWKGRPWEDTVVYEVHLGLEGGFEGMVERLGELVDLGITAIEIMPVNTFGGNWNWGYDGVLIYAPTTPYGRPSLLKAFIDHAHSLGLMVFLDVVYNHFGPDGNYLPEYAEAMFDPDSRTVWGEGIDFKNPIVADFFLDNALYWLMEYRFDGLRIDAAWAITDRNWFAKLLQRIDHHKEPGRHIHLILENENNDSGLLADGYDGQWDEDWHHAVTVLLSGETNGYFAAFQHNTIGLLRRVLAEGFAWQGEYFAPAEKMRGSPSGALPPTKFVTFLQNHDQIGNRPDGARMITFTDPDCFHAAFALLLLSPMTPMLFMGEEWGSTTPFYFFCNFHGELAQTVREGREEQFRKYSNITDPAALAALPDPNDPKTYAASRPDRAERDTPRGRKWLGRTKELLSIRHDRITPHLKGAKSAGAEVLSERAVLAQWTLANGTLLSVAINFGDETLPIAEPTSILYETVPDRVTGTLPPRSFMAGLDRPI